MRYHVQKIRVKLRQSISRLRTRHITEGQVFSLLLFVVLTALMIGISGIANLANADPLFDDEAELSSDAYPMVPSYIELEERARDAFEELDEVFNESGADQTEKSETEIPHTSRVDLQSQNDRSDQRKAQKEPRKRALHQAKVKEKRLDQLNSMPREMSLKQESSRPIRSEQSYERRVLDLVNIERSRGGRCGLRLFKPSPALRAHPLLDRAARAHGESMALKRFFAHQGLDGDSPRDRIEATGYKGQAWGENIAAGQKSPEEVVREWMNSPGHCQNILNPLFTELGISFVFEQKSPYKTYWVQAFGRPVAR